MFQQVNREWNKRPLWINLVWFFCLYMTFIYMPWDMFIKPPERWEEVWFGFTIRGWPAKVTEPVHWAIYIAGSYGFWKMARWMWPWAAIYAAQVTIGMIIFNVIAGPDYGDGRGGGTVMAVLIGAALAWLTWKLWQAKTLFDATAEQTT